MKNLIAYDTYRGISESLLSSVSIDKISSPDRIKDISYQDEFLKSLYKEENYLQDLEDDEIDEEDFLNWLQYDIKFKLEDLVDFYRREVIKNGRVTVWRKITVKESWMDHLAKEGKHLGVYWSWDPDAADTHWGDFNKKSVALIEAEVPENGVDWEETLVANIQPMIGEDEKEIKLHRGVPLKIISIEMDGSLADLTPIQGKTFYS